MLPPSSARGMLGTSSRSFCGNRGASTPAGTTPELATTEPLPVRRRRCSSCLRATRSRPTADLDRLARQLQAACLGGRSKTGGDERDPLFLAEAEALVQRFRGELRQIEADAFYGRALAGVRAQRPSSPAALLREARICFKLRDLAGARECAQSSRAASSAGAPAAASAARGLLPAEKEEALRLLRGRGAFRAGCGPQPALSPTSFARRARKAKRRLGPSRCFRPCCLPLLGRRGLRRLRTTPPSPLPCAP
jgi:hypothetical protein